MHIHILGICGTFMGGIALLAEQAGHRVCGSDEHVYPPMSDQLEAAGVTLYEGYSPTHLNKDIDEVVVGNVMSRGNPAIEAMLNDNFPYTSGPQWLAERVLRERWVLAVAGTHGKTTTASMLAWILEYAGLEPGFLIGGVPGNFGLSARLGAGRVFVVEADEYDTAFFDKRSKFVHYHPRTLILNNLEFDHADIFTDLADIKRQFHHLVRTVPGEGRLIVNRADANLEAMLAMGCWTPQEEFSLGDKAAGWCAVLGAADGSDFAVYRDGAPVAQVGWSLVGEHNVSNGVAAMAAAGHAGVPPELAARALGEFQGVKRRLELRGDFRGVTVYDDFAHHPTAIRSTLDALRARIGGQRLVAVLEPRSNTMRLGVHKEELAEAFAPADRVFLYQPEDIAWSLSEVSDRLGGKGRVMGSINALVACLAEELCAGDHVVIMSNGSFGGLHAKLASQLSSGTAGAEGSDRARA